MSKKLICYFNKGVAAGSLTLTTIDSETKFKIDKCCFDILPETVLNFIQNIPDFIINSAKAVIFIQIYDFKNPDFQTNSDFVRFILSTFKKLNIPIRLIDAGTFTLTHLLIAAKVNPKWDRNLIFIVVGGDTVFVEEVHREKEGYIRPPTKKTRIIKCSDGYDPMKIKEEILANIYPNKIFISTFLNSSKSILNDMLKVFGNDKYLKNNYENDIETIIEIALQLLDKKCNKYYVVPRFSFVVRNTEYDHLRVIWWDLEEQGFPSEKTCMDERSHRKYCIERYYDEQKEAETVQTYQMPKDQYHYVLLIFKVDSNMKPSLTLGRAINQTITSMPETLTEKMDSKIPIIGFFGDSSVICFWNETEKCYKFSEEWNGSFGEDLFISFDEKKPKYRNQALKVLKEKPTFVVYDLLKILSSKTSKIFVLPHWKFEITKDDENPVLIEFDDFDGTRKQATPEFLMALILKDHLKIIKEETGKKPDEIGFVLFDSFHDSKFWDFSLLPERIKNSCSMLKIGCKIVKL